MKVTIPRKDLVAALAAVKGAIASRSTLPILHHVAITANQSSVEFAATDLDLTIRNRAEATVRRQGETTVSAGLLHSLANSFTGEEVELELAKGRLRVECGQSKYELGTLGIEEFPPPARLEEPKEVRLTTAMLHRLLASTIAATGSDPSRYVICGSCIQLNGLVNVICTDGRRLHFNSLAAEEKLPRGEVIVPARAVKELLRLVPNDTDKRVTMAIGRNGVRFQFGEVTLVSKTIEGNYPNYQEVIPKWKEKDAVTVARADLLAALQRVALIHESCKLRFAGQTLTIEASNNKDVIGEGAETLLIPKVSRKLTITFNCRYLMDALASVGDDQVQFYAEDNTSPGVFRVAPPSPGGEGRDEGEPSHWQAVVMPMRTTEQMDEADRKAAEARAAEEKAKAEAAAKEAQTAETTAGK